jgi:DNA repair exonuclease SbcCD ATPase subunit
MKPSTGVKKPSVNVRVNGKQYKCIETFSRARLEHLLQLAQTAARDYQRLYTDFEKQIHQKPAIRKHYEELQQRVTIIEEVLHGLAARQEDL